MSGNGRLPAQRADLPVAVDAMGGDRGLGVQVEGAVQAYTDCGVHSILVGPEQELRSKLDSLGGGGLPIRIEDGPEVIGMDESPARAVRRKPNSSLCVAYRLVENGRASSLISAGNSGAMMAAGRFICGLLPGIERSAIATLIPVAGDGNPNVILDSGANVDCHAHNLVQFALMGAIYYSSLFEVHNPKIALLSNGTEPSKGTDLIRAAAQILSEMDSVNYVGYVEGRDVPTAFAQVVVCDGFTGNVLLKAMEGCVRLISDQLVHESSKSLVRKMAMGFSRGMYREVFLERFDYTAYGGAPLLGLRKLALVLHGSSDARAVKNAIRVSDTFAKSGMTEKIAFALAQLEESMPDMDGEIISTVFSKGRSFASDGKWSKRKEAGLKEETDSSDLLSEAELSRDSEYGREEK